MMGKWFYKLDGTLQCNQGAEIPLAQMQREIEAIVGAGNVAKAEKKMHPDMRPQMCGRPTGRANRYSIEIELTTDLRTKLEAAGFREWPDGGAGMMKGNTTLGGGDAWPWGKLEGVDILPWAARGGGDVWPWKTAEGTFAPPPAFAENPNSPDVIGYLASVRSAPSLVSDLLGFRCRVITPDTPGITLELLPNRVNIFVDEKGRIADIKFF